MSLLFQFQQIKKKKSLFKKFIIKHYFLYKNIVNQIILFVTDEHNNIKTYLTTQSNKYTKYTKKIKNCNLGETNHIIDAIFQESISYLKHYSLQYYDKVIENEKIGTVYDLLGLFIECCSLFVNEPIKDIEYNYNYNSYLGLLDPTLRFIQFNKKLFIEFNNITTVDNCHVIEITFTLNPIGEQGSVFCDITKKVLSDLFSKFCEFYYYYDIVFNNNYYTIQEEIIDCNDDDGQISLTIHVKQNK